MKTFISLKLNAILFQTFATRVLLSITFCLFVSLNTSIFAQTNPDKGTVYIDDSGVMHWGGNDQEVKGFGINYSVPFAHAYRQAMNMGIDPKKAIDDEIYHFSRLGFDLYRLHVWDTEISDSLGNLIENKHLDTFDYLLKKLKDNDINYVITPIAFWGNGWPEPDEDTPGFSHKYGKGNSLDNPKAIKAAQNYLEQFLNHVNPYTGVAYKNEPNIIAFEISNEPHHRGEAREVTSYVNKMVTALKKTGTKKPIFYNMSHGVHFAQAYFDGGVQGGTFQWYPTGLGYGQELPGNLLPNVNDYNITFDEIIKANQGAKLVYEFDAADVGRSYIYPVMARSFREAGIQIATHFAYDPTYLAPYNTEYNTHYMNLAYTPQKALSLMIAGKVFHEAPLYKDYGPYPNNTTFGNVYVEYKKDLALYNTDSTYIYTNATTIEPKNINTLTKIAGYGDSPIVTYDGSGAYFLDQINEGVWRLEVMPDAVWVDNPFGRNSPHKTVAVIKWETHNMQLNEQLVNSNFTITPINEGNIYQPVKTNDAFTIKPGTYILDANQTKNWTKDQAFGNTQLQSFFAPKSTVNKPWFKHQPPSEVSAGKKLDLQLQFVAPYKPQEIKMHVQSGFERETLSLRNVHGYTYSTTVPEKFIKEGYLNYTITIEDDKGQFTTYPAGDSGRPFDWDFYNNKPYQIRIVSPENPIYLFNAKDDSNQLVRQWKPGFKLQPTTHYQEAEYLMPIDKLFVPDNENLNAEPIYDYTFKHYIIDAIAGRKSDVLSKDNLVVKGRSLNNKATPLQVAFVMDNGAAYGAMMTLDTTTQEYTLDLKDLKSVKTVTLPRPYPSFLPYYLEHNLNEPFDIKRIESLQFSIGPNIPKNDLENPQGIGLISVWLE